MKHGKLNPVGKNYSEFPVDLGFLCDEAPSTPTAHMDRTKWTHIAGGNNVCMSTDYE